MLVECEFHEVDGMVQCDLVCSHCGEIAKERVSRMVVTTLVLCGLPVLCQDCESSKCQICGRFPTPGDEWIPGGNCWECQRAVDLITLAWAAR